MSVAGAEVSVECERLIYILCQSPLNGTLGPVVCWLVQTPMKVWIVTR